LEKICQYWTVEYQKIVQSFTLNEQGKPVPQDIAKQNADILLKTYLPTGSLPCPVELPESENIDIVWKFIENLDPMFFAKAYMTLLFIAGQGKLAIQNLNKSMKALPKREAFVDMFLTECSQIELANKDLVPLQCVDPAVEKATEKEQRLKQDPEETKRIAKLRQELSKKLALLLQNLSSFRENFAKNTNDTVEKLKKTIAQLQASKRLLEETKSDQEQLRRVSEEITKQENELGRYILYQQLMNKKPMDLLADYEKDLEEAKAIQQRLESGNFTQI